MDRSRFLPPLLNSPPRMAPRSGKIWPILLVVLIAATGTLALLSGMNIATPQSESQGESETPVEGAPAGGNRADGVSNRPQSSPQAVQDQESPDSASEPDAPPRRTVESASGESPASEVGTDAPRAGSAAPQRKIPDSLFATSASAAEPGEPTTGQQTAGSDNGTGSGQEATKSGGLTAPKGFAQDWPMPSIVLAITGQQHGYIEPCGCSPKQSGGLARRADLLRQLRQDRKWSVLALESGGTLDESRVTRHQSTLKFRMIQDAFNAMEYRSLGLGTEELKLGPIKLFENFSTRNVEEGFDLPFVAANVVLLGSPELGTPLPFRLVKIDGKKVAVTSIFGNSFKKDLSLISEDELTITDPEQALPAVIKSMQTEKPDLMVLMSYDEPDGSRSLAEKFPEFQVVVSAGGADDPGDDHEMIGQTLFFVSGMKGKYVNLVGIYPGQNPPVRFERVELDQDRFKRAPKMRELMAQYQDALKEQWLDPASEVRGLTFPHESGHQFVGAKACQTCHASAYEIWESSAHAHATVGLREGRPEETGEWIDRTWDPECLCCHATGWNAREAFPYSDGFIEEMTTPHLTGNQCENCHGPGSEHVKLETDWKKSGGALSDALLASRKFVTVSKAQAEKKVCLNCHDFANSPNFNFEDYWPQIEHPTPDSEKQK